MKPVFIIKSTYNVYVFFINKCLHFLYKIMIAANFKNNRRRKIYCAIVLFVGAVSLFAWHLAVNDGQQKWLITWLAIKESKNSQDANSLLENLLKNSKSLRYGLYADLKKSLTKMRNFTNSSKILEKSQPTPFPRKVLIVSRGRSGSSFLGDLFNQNKEVFYLFEPLGWSVSYPKGYETKTYKVLDDLYNCKFTDKIYLDFLLKEKSFRRKSEKLSTFPGQCSRISRSSQRCLSNILKSSCLDARSVMAKVLTHRLPQGGLWGIRKILDANKNLRIVHLLRDPRRVIASMKKAGWFKGKNFITQVKYVCSSIWENVKHVQNDSVYYKDRYKLLVFSDMMLSPFSTVVELYHFLKMGPVPEYIFSWIIQNTMGSVQSVQTRKYKSRGTYRTSRNSTEVLTRKVDFSKFEEKIIDKYCSDVIKFIDQVRKIA